MKIGFSLYFSEKLLKYNNMVNDLEEKINTFLQGKNYGSSISDIYIGFICVEDQFNRFFKPRPPSYNKGEKIYEKEDVLYTLNNTFQYDIKLNYDFILNLDNEIGFQKVLAESILASLKRELFNKVDGFDFSLFSSDLHSYFRKLNLIN